ncbi:MAG TPA: efflux RND transporter periplasmic adaptor subunit [Myxococcales bacterium]|nr:efflux RND transporter periplasmic adaptor subunit [Myxococcales bacterium]
MTQSIKWLAPAVAVLAWGCHRVEGAEASRAAPQRPPAPVAIATAVHRDVPIYLDEIGKNVAPEVVNVQPQVGGRITALHFKDGATVKRGDLLFTIDPRPYRAQLDSAEASLARNVAELDLARLEFGRVQELLRTDAISQQDHDARRSAVAVSEAQVRLSKAAVDTARLNLEYCFIRSPIDGRAGQRLVDLGNVVAPGPASVLLVIQRLDPMYADFTIPENDLTAVQRAVDAGTVRVEVRLPDGPDSPRNGKLTFLDNVVRDGTGTVKLRATTPNPDWRFWPGRFVKVRLVLGDQKNAVLVPATAPQTSAKGPFVYVVKEDSTAELRPVTVGQRQGDLVAVAEGLKGGERVVTAGHLGVTPGGKVRSQQP